jgi:galactokinase/mevalonate kinase-like predicted kinase
MPQSTVRFAFGSISPHVDGKLVFHAKDLNRKKVIEAAPRLQPSSPLRARSLKFGAIGTKNAWLADNIPAMARIPDDSCNAKKMTGSRISVDSIDPLRNVTFANGALAEKMSAAGCADFSIFLVLPEDRMGLLSAAGGTAGSVKFTERGCEP